jgi:hypothetical protein
MRNFMLAFGNLDTSGEVALRDLLGENGYKFWHRFPNVWIVITPDDVDALNLQLAISNRLVGAINVLVAEFEREKLAGRIAVEQTDWFEKHLQVPSYIVEANKVPK